MIDPTEYATVTGAARELGLVRTTLLSAIARGEVEPVTLADGMRIVRLDDVNAWAKVIRKRGPKPGNLGRDK